MATQPKTDAWHRYMLYRSNDTRLMSFASREEKQAAIDAGRKFTSAAHSEVWAKDAGKLSQRVGNWVSGV
jgi:hypothetical protein